MKKRIMISILIIVLILSAVLIYTNELLKPLPEGIRNISSSNIKMLVNIEDSRTARGLASKLWNCLNSYSYRYLRKCRKFGEIIQFLW